ncbi:hypothetical protein GCM10027186_08280 [Micromonospora schwarzwaldensis]
MRVTDPLRTSLAVRSVGALGGKGVVLGVLGAVLGAGGPVGSAAGAGATPAYAAGAAVPASAVGAAIGAVASTAVDSTTATGRPHRGRRNSADEWTPLIPRRCR